MSWTASVEILKETDRIWEIYTEKTTQKQPKIHFSGPMKRFENSWLGNHKYYANETYRIMFLHETFHLAKNWGIVLSA